MPIRSITFTLTGSILGGAFVLLMFYTMLRPVKNSSPLPNLTGNGAQGGVSAGPNKSLRYNLSAVERARQRLSAMQETLDATRRQLQVASVELNAKTDECESLNEQLESALDFALELVQSPQPALNEPATDEFMPRSLEPDLAELGQAEVLRQLQAALSEADMQIADLQQRAEAEVLAISYERDLMRDAAAALVLRLGSSTVPALSDMLADPRPQVRNWSASILGDLGRDAADALAALRSLESDSDEVVRATATSAIRKIQRDSL